ncbi:uncharacterized protein LOC135948562 [Cloeon dipterum]|uniref:uncharacterized protein LOC135948562 n=1 Tax=Cloeon dipterum TaxID=197152 RepID=UPI00321FB8B5
MDQIMHSLAAKKLKALKSGEAADLSIITKGIASPKKEGASHIKVYASKADLIAASDYFKSKLQGEPQKDSIELEGFDSEIVTLVVEFTFLSGWLMTEVKDLNQCLMLARAAQEFKIDSLGELCGCLLSNKFLELNQIWRVYDGQFGKAAQVKVVLESARKFVSEKVKECMLQPGFIDIKHATLVDLLNVHCLRVESEAILVQYSQKLAKEIARLGLKTLAKEVFREYFLPHLRLLTLKAEEMGPVLSMIESEEAIHFARVQAPPCLKMLLPNKSESFRCGFSTIVSPRYRRLERRIGFLARENHLGLHRTENDFIWKNYFFLSEKEQKFVLSFVAPFKMTVTKLEVVLPLRKSHYNAIDVFKCLAFDPLTCFELPSKATITTSLIADDDLSLYSKGDFENPWSTWKTFNFVEKGSQVSIEFCFNAPCFYKRAALDCEISVDIPFTFKLFDRSEESSWMEVQNQGTNLFHSLSYETFEI